MQWKSNNRPASIHVGLARFWVCLSSLFWCRIKVSKRLSGWFLQMGNSKRCGMTFTDKIQPLNYYKTQGYPIPIILSLLLGMTFGTLKFTSRRKLNSAYLYTNLHIQIRVAEWRRKQRFFLHVYLTQKVCEVCRLFNSSSNVAFIKVWTIG